MNPSTRILIVSKEAPATSALGQALQTLGYQAGHAVKADAAIRQLDSGVVDLLFIHAELGAEDKAEVLACLETCTEATCPAVLVYTDNNLDALKALLETNKFDYLLPPFDPVLLRARLDVLLERKRLSEHQEDNAKREELLKLERDIQIGRTIQQGFLPETLPQPPGWEITACFHPAREVAGDFYDAFYLINKRRLGFVIADVCDKGVGAALFMAIFRTLIRSGAQQHTSLSWMDSKSGAIAEDKDWLKGDPNRRRQSLPSIGTGALMNAVEGTNNYITENHLTQGYFVTLFFGVLDPSNGSLLYINGGHNPPVIIRSDGTQELLKPTGPAVGMLPGASYKMGQTQLGPGDILYAYTDGVTDARAFDGRFFSEQRLFSLVSKGASSAMALVSEIESQLYKHIGDAPQFDDITMIALRRSLNEKST